ncbi:hypothetical protein [Alteraurantiacibacter aquimixticola]|uniref:RiboL-PSP-HEPN domain-containing protein n=1 Tax=Alteraurantiacibacter aquimixticola TaxID=2489173 RepID=A0A4T3F2L0_9SPHN|nr:hypothetical protein [Alteraurantiacibacter aquimixticola]TIX48840.1 hypothetical protein E5222_13930 [Alteraurantiacibacter aquimixticola]
MTELTDLSLTRILVEDATAAITRNRQSDTQVTRRDLVRTSFACVEGLVQMMKQSVNHAADVMELFEEGEKQALSEQAFSVTSRGKVSLQQKFVPLPSAFRLCVRIVGRLSSDFSVVFDDGNWQNFLRFVELRNALTHPKSMDDVAIDNMDKDLCIASFFWIMEAVLEAIETVNSKLKIHQADMRQILEDLKASDAKVLAEYEEARLRLLSDS